MCLSYASFCMYPDNQYVLRFIRVTSARFGILQSFINHEEIIWHFLHSNISIIFKQKQNLLFHHLWTVNCEHLLCELVRSLFYKCAIAEVVGSINLLGFGTCLFIELPKKFESFLRLVSREKPTFNHKCPITSQYKVNYF